MEGYNAHRHDKNPKEKEFHDNFIKEHDKERSSDMDFIVFGHSKNELRPNNYLTEKEKRIVLSTIQWLGSSVGQSFLSKCGFNPSK